MHHKQYVEQVPIKMIFDVLLEPTREPTEYLPPYSSPYPSSVGSGLNSWQLAIVIGVFSSALTTGVLLCAGSLYVRYHVNLRRIASSLSSSSSQSSHSSSSKKEDREDENSYSNFMFPDIYPEDTDMYIDSVA